MAFSASYACAQGAAISIEDAAVKPGGSVKVELSLSDCRELKSFCLYDFVCNCPDIEIESGKWELSLPVLYDNLNLETNDAVIGYAKNTDCNGKIFKLSLKASEQAKPGKYSLTCSAVAKSGEENGNEVFVPITVKPAVIEISSSKSDNTGSLPSSDNGNADPQTNSWVEKTVSGGNAQLIGDIVADTLKDMGVKSVGELDKAQQPAFVSSVLTEFEKQGIETADFPESFGDSEKAAAIGALYEKTGNNADGSKPLLLASVCAVIVAVVVTATVFIKRKNNSA